MRRAPRVDRNQAAIIGYLRMHGVDVASLAGMGSGIPDLVCAYHGYTWLVEVKMPGGKLTADQVRFHDTWCGEICIVESEADVDEMMEDFK